MWIAQTNPSEVFDIGATNSERLDFLIVLIGVILGLSIGRLVNFIGDFLYNRNNGKASWTHGIFLTSLFLFQVYYWWDIWDLKNHLQSELINFWIFIRMLLIPLCLYCATALLCPRLTYPKGEEKLSMRDLFDSHARPFYFFWVLLCIIGISQGMDLRGESWGNPEIYFRIIAGVIFLFGLIVQSSVLNGVLSIVMFLMLIGYITVPFWWGLVSAG
ncbi:MAG: hypothetical protein P1V20_08925 [Verrucomicrobiales bacterium]|nr:hypothetical protein [Verrucomicrobiales bacterium]